MTVTAEMRAKSRFVEARFYRDRASFPMGIHPACRVLINETPHRQKGRKVGRESAAGSNADDGPIDPQ